MNDVNGTHSLYTIKSAKLKEHFGRSSSRVMANRGRGNRFYLFDVILAILRVNLCTNLWKSSSSSYTDLTNSSGIIVREEFCE